MYLFRELFSKQSAKKDFLKRTKLLFLILLFVSPQLFSAEECGTLSFTRCIPANGNFSFSVDNAISYTTSPKLEVFINGIHVGTFNPINCQQTSIWTCDFDISIPAASIGGPGTYTFSTRQIPNLIECAQGTFTILGPGGDETAPVPDINDIPPVSVECSTPFQLTPPTATDNCAGLVTGTTNAPNSYSTIGSHLITWTYDDGNGNTSTQIQTVIVEDNTAPVPDISNLPTITVECMTNVSPPTATDNCAGTISGTTNDPTSYNTIGSHLITWTFDDGNGNTSTQTQTVIVGEDNTAPVPDITNLPTITQECTANVSPPTATDHCAGTIIGTTNDPTSYNTIGSYLITWTYDDGNGNSSTQTQTVNVVEDNTPPVPNRPELWVINAECNTPFLIIQPSAIDNCAGFIFGTTNDYTGPRAAGTYYITWTYDDGNGNTSQQVQTIIISDNQPPYPNLSNFPDIENLPAIVGECSVTVNTIPTANDNCDGTITGTTNDPLFYDSPGTYPIKWTYEDGTGNHFIQTQLVIVEDNTAPVPDIGNLPTITRECNVNISPPTATDNCAGTIIGTTNDPTSYSIAGSHLITWTFNDGNGNTSTQTQTVIVEDDTAPVPDIVNLPTITRECVVKAPPPTATDDCAGTIIGTTNDPTSYNTIGSHLITWTYDDGNGNISTQTQTVIVEDNTAPIPDMANLPTITGECTANISPPTATDNCAGTIIGATDDPTSYSTVGSHLITWNFDDGHGNISTQTQTVIVEDNTAPVPDVTNLPTITQECMANVSPPTATDNCAGTIIGTTNDPTNYSTVGSHLITWTYDDGNGNTSQQVQTIIISDTEHPLPSLFQFPGLENLPAIIGECSVTVNTIPTAFDNCDGRINGTTNDPLFYDTPGTYPINWTYEDGAGNYFVQIQMVIVEDNTAPVPDVANLPTITQECNVNISPPTATDNCAGTIIGTTNDPTSYSTVGSHLITWTYDDGNGNISTQTQTVIVEDNSPPVPTITSLFVINVSCNSDISILPPFAIDDCAGIITANPIDFSQYTEPGSYFITWTYDDGNGNISTQTQALFISDNEVPVPDVTNLPSIVGECSVEVTSIPTATDNCKGTIMGTTNDPLSYNSPGTYNITWNFDDGNGNISTQTQTVIVVEDNTPPVPDKADLVAFEECGIPFQITPPTATDNCAGKITGTTDDLIVYDEQKNYTITWTFDDGNGNTTTQIQIIFVDDYIAPVPDVAELPVLRGECFVEVTTIPTSTDLCKGTIIGTTYDPLIYSEPGEYEITWIYNDKAGNRTTQIQKVIIEDNTAPEPDLPFLPIIKGECEVIVYTLPTSTDNCDNLVIGTTNDPTTYNTIGTHIITWAFVDSRGNTSTQLQKVIVEDNTKPVPNIASLPIIYGNCEAGLEPPYATDNCAGQIIGTTSDPLYFDKEGTYTVTWVFDDGNGNTSSQDQTIIIEDDIAPVPDRQTLPTIRRQCSATVTSIPTATDRCGGAIQGTTSDPLTYNTQGIHIITWTYDDGNGNSITQTQRVVIRDNKAPVPDQASLPALTGSCSVMITHFPTASDNCAGSVTATTDSPLEFDQEGTYAIVWNYDDGNGNTNIQTQWVIVGGEAAPNARCKDISVPMTGNGSVNISASNLDNGSYDDCSSVTLLISPAGSSIFGSSLPPAPSMDLHCKDGKEQNLLLSVTNEKGNTAHCQAKVTLQGTDTDNDGILDSCDNCPDTHNPDQQDDNNNGTGDACEENSNPRGWGGWSLKKQGQEDNIIITELKAFPNPFQEEIHLSFNLSQEEKTTVEIFNIQGQRVHTLLSEIVPEGEHRVLWDGKDQNGQSLSSGIYLIRLRAGKALINQKVILQR